MAKPTRRSVLRTVVVAAAAAVPLASVENAMSVVAGGMASGLRRSTFKPHLKSSSFLLVGAHGSYRAKLIEVSDLGGAPAGHNAKFRLLFHVRGKPGEGTYLVRHRNVAATDLFLAPVGAAGDVYEAVVDAR